MGPLGGIWWEAGLVHALSAFAPRWRQRVALEAPWGGGWGAWAGCRRRRSRPHALRTLQAACAVAFAVPRWLLCCSSDDLLGLQRGSGQRRPFASALLHRAAGRRSCGGAAAAMRHDRSHRARQMKDLTILHLSIAGWAVWRAPHLDRALQRSGRRTCMHAKAPKVPAAAANSPFLESDKAAESSGAADRPYSSKQFMLCPPAAAPTLTCQAHDGPPWRRACNRLLNRRWSVETTCICSCHGEGGTQAPCTNCATVEVRPAVIHTGSAGNVQHAAAL